MTKTNILQLKMAKCLLFVIFLFLGVWVMGDDDDLIEVPTQGVYTVSTYDEQKARTYAKDLGWTSEQEEALIIMLAKHCSVRFETKDGKFYNITFFSDDRVAPMEIEDGKEVPDMNVVGIPVKNKLVKEPKALHVRQTMESGKYTDISWTFKPDLMIITLISNSHKAEVILKKVS